MGSFQGRRFGVFLLLLRRRARDNPPFYYIRETGGPFARFAEGGFCKVQGKKRYAARRGLLGWAAGAEEAERVRRQRGFDVREGSAFFGGSGFRGERPARKKPSGFGVREDSAFFGGSDFRGGRPARCASVFSFREEKGGKKRKNLKNPLDKRKNGWYTTKAARKKGRNSDKGPGSAGRNLKKFWKVLDKRAALGYNR